MEAFVWQLLKFEAFAKSPGVLMVPVTCVLAAEFPLVVSVLPAAALLLQAGAALATVTGLPLNLPDTHPHRWSAGFSAAAPEAPLAHSAVLSWTMKAALSGRPIHPNIDNIDPNDHICVD